MQVEVIVEDPFIVVGKRLQDSLKTYIIELNPESVVIVCDKNTFKFCYPVYKDVFDSFEKCQTVIIDEGDKAKNLESAALVWEELFEISASRKSLVIALGGGMICDLAAFAASVYMRGIQFVLLPTTILAMVDAAVGGKTAINFKTLKNLIGTFKNPSAVFADLDFLETQAREDANSGKAEMLKHSLLQGKSKFDEFRNEFDKALSISSTAASMRFKLNITQNDFEEKGNREILNLGHTSAHALESLFMNKSKVLLHGNAVAAGLWIESFISELYFDFKTGFDFKELRSFINLKFTKVEFGPSDIPFLLNAMVSDKKNKYGLRSFVLLTENDSHIVGCHPSEEMIETALIRYVQNA